MIRFAAAALAVAIAFASVPGFAQSTAVDQAPQIGQVSKDSVWVPTPERMIHRLLQIADTTKRDVVMDLGSGDGRMTIYASKHFGAPSIGVELEPNLVRVSRENARKAGVAHLAKFLQQDLFEADLSKVTVFALYISPGVMTKLKPRFLELKPGVRIASHHFNLEDWEPDEIIKVEERTGYLWVVPAKVEGSWTLQIPGDELKVRIEQKYQMLKTTGERGGKPVNVIGAKLRGTEIRFTAFDVDGNSRQYRGRVEGNRMGGEAEGQGMKTLRWTATRG